MNSTGSPALIAGGTLTAIAAVAHLACIFLGAPAYRFMGAGFPENSTAFWLWSSGSCLVLGLLYGIGAVHVWTAR